VLLSAQRARSVIDLCAKGTGQTMMTAPPAPLLEETESGKRDSVGHVEIGRVLAAPRFNNEKETSRPNDINSKSDNQPRNQGNQCDEDLASKLLQLRPVADVSKPSDRLCEHCSGFKKPDLSYFIQQPNHSPWW